MKRRVLIIIYNGALIKVKPDIDLVDMFNRIEFLPGVIRNLYKIRQRLDFEMVLLITKKNFETPDYKLEKFNRIYQKIIELLANEGIIFDKILINDHFSKITNPIQNAETNLLKSYLKDTFDSTNSYIIGDSEIDMQIAENIGCKGILLIGKNISDEIKNNIALKKGFHLLYSWDIINEFLQVGERQATVQRVTKETDIFIQLNLDGSGISDISTGIGFFNHLLEQISRHSGIDLIIKVKGDLHVDEHHSVEDTAIAFGEAICQALGNKMGIERYGFCLPMDDCICNVAIDFGGRSFLVWDVQFNRERVGDLPMEMLPHFFKSLSDAAKMNLHIKADGENEHHKAESIFKAFAKAIKMAVKRDLNNYTLPSTKEVL